MRGRRREVLVILTTFLLGALAPSAPAFDRVGMTVELSWTVAEGANPQENAADSQPPVMVELTEGAVVEAVAWPPPADPSSSSGRSGPSRTETGAWRLGQGPSGRVRMRIETGLGGEIVVSRGEVVSRTPIADALDQIPGAPAPADLLVTVERLSWDALMIDFGSGAEDGTAAPGAVVPVTIGYNILQPDAAEVTVRTIAALRPIGRADPVWRSEQSELVAANRHDPSSRVWSIPAPEKEGTYVLEVQAIWEAAGARDVSRLGRLIRRRRALPGSGAASRRVVLTVFDSEARSPAASLIGGETPPRETEVDAFDLTRPRNARFSTWGRSPAPPSGSAWEVPREILVEAARREKEREWLRSFIAKAGAEPARLKAADASGMAWSAVALRVARPEKPHRLSLTIAEGSSSALGVAMVDPGGGGRSPRLVLDASALVAPSPETVAHPQFDWIVWPGASEPLLVLFNRDPSDDITVGAVKLVELDPAPTAGEAISKPDQPARGVGLHLAAPGALDRFGGVREQGMSDALGIAENLSTYLATCGGSVVILPDHLADRHRRRALSGLLHEDSTGPDRLDMTLRVLRRHGQSAWLELDLEGENALPGLPPPGSAEALQEGLARVGRQGVVDDGMTYNPLHPKTQEAMKRRVVEALDHEGDASRFSGILIRLGRGPTLLGPPDTGIDDDTFARFVQETLGREAAREVPGQGAADPDRFAARSKYLAGVGRMPWLTWRAKAIAGLYAELAEAARTASPGAVLAVATPTLEAGPAGTEARRVDMAGLAPSLAWRSVGLDFEQWETGPNGPVALRAAELATDALARDLATHADLDAKVAPFAHRGFLLNTEGELARSSRPTEGAGRGERRLFLKSLPLGDDVTADELPAHALAGIDARWVILSTATAAGFEGRIRRFGEVLRLLPPDESPTHPPAGQDSGVVARSLAGEGRTVLQLVNDTPYSIRLAGVLKGVDAAAVDDLGRKLRLAPRSVEGGRQLVVDLAPFGVSAIRVDAPRAKLEAPTPYPPEAVLAVMEARYQELSAQLGRLNRGLAGAPADALSEGFEPREARLASTHSAETGEAPPAGWRLVEPADDGAGASLSLDADRPHAGSRSLKLESAQAPASVVSGDFSLVDGASLLVQAHLRGDRDHAVVRLWIEGESAGKPYVRRSEMVVTPDWRPLAVRVSDPPAEGLDSVRLRFEKTTPGAIWIDDVRVTGEAAPKAVRLNAQRAMLAALQAHRERRYADFARLADSHWAKHPGVAAMIRPARGGEMSASRAQPNPADSDPPAASALSGNRALR